MVIAVVSVELLPEVRAVHSVAEVAGGFTAGVVLMLGLRRLFGGEARDGRAGAALVATGIDIAVDGLLVGIGFVAGAKQGLLVTLGLALELLALGLAIATQQIRAGATRMRAVAVPTGIASLLLVGAVVGSTVLAHASPDLLAVVLSFACAALLYPATEELLVEAHEVPETPTATGAFFAGFLLVLVVGMLG